MRIIMYDKGIWEDFFDTKEEWQQASQQFWKMYLLDNSLLEFKSKRNLQSLSYPVLKYIVYLHYEMEYVVEKPVWKL